MSCEEGKSEEFVQKTRQFLAESDYDGFKTWYDEWSSENSGCSDEKLLGGIVVSGQGEVFKLLKEISKEPDKEEWMQNKTVMMAGAVGLGVLVIVIVMMVIMGSRQPEYVFPQ